MLALQQYMGSSDEEDQNKDDNTEKSEVSMPIQNGNISSVNNQIAVCAAPEVLPTGLDDGKIHIHPDTEELNYNAKYEDLFAPVLGPLNPFKTQQQQIEKNVLSGHIEPAHVSEFQFETQRRTFASFGYALDPSVSIDGQIKVVGSTDEGKDPENVVTVFETTKVRPLDKRKRKKNSDPSDIEGFLGPWGGYVDEQKVAKPTEEEKVELLELSSKKSKRGKLFVCIYIADYLNKFFVFQFSVQVNLWRKNQLKKNLFYISKTQWTTKEGHSFMLIKMLELILNLILHLKNVFFPNPIFTHGQDIPKVLQPYVGFLEQLICFCQAVWIVELNFGRYTMNEDAYKHIMDIDKQLKISISTTLVHIFCQQDMTGENFVFILIFTNIVVISLGINQQKIIFELFLLFSIKNSFKQYSIYIVML